MKRYSSQHNSSILLLPPPRQLLLDQPATGRTKMDSAARYTPSTMTQSTPHLLRIQHIFESVMHSLQRLQLDYVDVLQCHFFDKETPISETMHALHDVVKAGYARYIGMSNCLAWQFHVMQNYAITNNLTPFISMQNHHNLVYREDEREMFPTLKVSLDGYATDLHNLYGFLYLALWRWNYSVVTACPRFFDQASLCARKNYTC
jgi:hypothetical protein